METVYICAPLSADTIEYDLRMVRKYYEQFIDMNRCPLSRHMLCNLLGGDVNHAQYNAVLPSFMQVIESCAYVLVFGTHITEDMAKEIELAQNLGVEVVYVNPRLKDACVRIGA
jgi:hypothetical protein